MWFPITDAAGETISWVARPIPSFRKQKFLSPNGGSPPIWVPRSTYAAARDSHTPIVLTEGPVKGLMLLQAGACPIALSGVWTLGERAEAEGTKDSEQWDEDDPRWFADNWDSDEETRSKSFELRCELSEPHFNWFGRTVYFAFDQDQATNRGVRHAVIRSWVLLRVAGAIVKQLSWSDTDKGIDDYLAAKAGTDPKQQRQVLESLFAEAKEFHHTLIPGPGGDAELVKRELSRCDMGSADRSAFAKQAASRLKVRPSDLLPPKAQQHQPKEGPNAMFARLDPWPETIDGEELLRELEGLIRKHVFISSDYALACALWIIWSYLIQEDFLDKSPYLGITGADKRVGKTRLLDLIGLLVWKGYGVGRLSEAALYRLIEQYGPTLLLDEFHRLLSKYPNLIDLLLTAYDRGKKVVLSNAETHAIDQFSCWSAKAFTYLGDLDPQLRDRVIEIYLDRKPKGEKRAKLRETLVHEFEVSRRKCLRWTSDNRDKIRRIRPIDLEVTNDRATDNWEFLLAIAGVIGQECAKRAYAVALKQEGEERNDDALGPLVLMGLKAAFEAECKTRGSNCFLSLVSLCDELNADELAPWSEWSTKSGEKGITPRKLSEIIRGYRIKPKRERTEHSVDPGISQRRKNPTRGYRFRQLQPLFEKYL